MGPGTSKTGQMLAALERGQPRAAEELLPLVYDELRSLAARKLAQEKPGQTLQATALVHEAWLRLGGESSQTWDGKAHFFAAAAEAMRRILIDRARRKQSLRRGEEPQRVELDALEIPAPLPDEQLLAVHEALDDLAREDAAAADLVKLRFFVGLTHAQAAGVLGLNRSTAEDVWVFARAWLFHRMEKERI